jgi:alpha-galactosidase
MSAVIDEVRVDPAIARVYAEGWQSWSPAAWYPAAATGPAPRQEWEHAMRFRPGTPVAATGLQGEGLLAVDPGTGEPARLYGSADPTEIPTLHATLTGSVLTIRSTGPVHTWTAADGTAALLAFGDALGVPQTPPPTVWCSWYRYFEQVTAADVKENLVAIDRHRLRVDVVQIDDGWSPGLGEGLVDAARFGRLSAVVDGIRGSGRRAGVWIAPFTVGRQTALAREHPDWLAGPAGRNWGQDLAGLDLANPGVRYLLAAHLQRLVAMGVDYLKLDFLYAGAVGGVAAYRSGLELVRDVVGEDVYLVGCGAPLLPSVGLVDAMRVSPDTFHEGGEDGSTGLPGLMALTARAWQQGRLWVNDPDCVVARPSYSQRERWAGAAMRYGGVRSFSDRIADLDEWGLERVRDLLDDGGTSAVLPLDDVDSGAAASLAEASA